MPKIVIWMPHDENQAGHVAIKTNKYYVSFWPANCLEKDGKNFRTISKGVDFVMEVHKGCLVFHQDLDKEYEGDCDPDYVHAIDAAKVSNEDLNAVIEEFLRYNEINPEDVTLAKGEEKYQEYKELSALLTWEQGDQREDRELPQKSLAKTKYSIVTVLVSSKKDDDSAPFYKSQQSCVSFAFNLIQTAWLKLHPNPIPIVNYEEAKSSSKSTISNFLTSMLNFLAFSKKTKELPYKVPWFEKEVVRRYLISDELNNQPIISVQPTIEKEVRGMKSFYVSTFVLLLIGYFFPDTGYPNVFIFWNFVGEQTVIYEPLNLLNFIFPLLIILLDFNWCDDVVLSVVIFHLGELSYYFLLVSILLLVGYLIPETAYPNVFIHWNSVGEGEDEVIDEPSFVSDFILPLSITLFAHYFSWSVAVFAYVIFLCFKGVMKFYRSGEFWRERLNRFLVVLVEVLSFLRTFLEKFRGHCRLVYGREPEVVDLVRMFNDFRKAQ